jgi:hypothetical protein
MPSTPSIDHLKQKKSTTLRKEFALAVDAISPIMNEITIRMSPVKKCTKRTTFCKKSENVSTLEIIRIMQWKLKSALKSESVHLRHGVVRKEKCKAISQ